MKKDERSSISLLPLLSPHTLLLTFYAFPFTSAEQTIICVPQFGQSHLCPKLALRRAIKWFLVRREKTISVPTPNPGLTLPT